MDVKMHMHGFSEMYRNCDDVLQIIWTDFDFRFDEAVILTGLSPNSWPTMQRFSEVKSTINVDEANF